MERQKVKKVIQGRGMAVYKILIVDDEEMMTELLDRKSVV